MTDIAVGTTGAWIAVLMMAVITYGSRLLGYLLGSRVAEGSRLRRLLDVLPGCAIAAVIAPQVARAGLVEAVALIAAWSLLWFTGRTTLALILGIAILIAGGHLGAGSFTTL